LVKLAENNQFSKDFDGQKEIRCWLTQVQLASLSGCSRQSFTQTMNTLKNVNLLTYDARRILIYNIDDLKTYKK
jgi:CRP-like cAMP-binding protein